MLVGAANGHFLILGAGYIGARLAELALAAGYDVVLADNWHATRREQLEPLERLGARVETADIRRADDLDRLLACAPARVYLLAAQASRPLAERDPDYTEETNVTGARRVADAIAAHGGVPLVYGSSLHVYGPSPRGEVGPDRPYGEQGDLAHLSKVYGELCLSMYARRHDFDLALLRLGIVYGPSPVEHERPESRTVVDTFRRLAARGEPLPLDDGGRATIGVVHVDDAARILLAEPSRHGVSAANVAAESTTVADVAALARGESPARGAACTFVTPYEYEHRLAAYLAP
jgi:nucleoside-diphosphate-sugar epimerase